MPVFLPPLRPPQVKAIYPVEVRPVASSSESTASASESMVRSDETPENQEEEHRQQETCEHESWDPPVSVDHLTPDQQKRVIQMLREECAAFLKDENDVGCIPSLQLKIRLHDTTPVRHTHTSVPKPLHKELKEYLEDLLNRGWIKKIQVPVFFTNSLCPKEGRESTPLCGLSRVEPFLTVIPSLECKTC